MRRWFGILALTIAPLSAADVDRVDTSIAVPDIHGQVQHPFRATGKAGAALVFFITNDCPISNGYAHEIRRICDGYSGRASCTLDYVDPTLTAKDVSKHAADYGHGDYPLVIDTSHILVKAAGATVTPEAALIQPDGKIAYRGRIDDRYFSLGKARPDATVKDLRSAIDAVLTDRPIETPRTTAIGCFITPLEFFKNVKH
ncbi:MAG TPA: hypothetical protein VGN17_12655 [Bryobacteraceae bacterium]|jgi:hypothetical protein